MRASGASGTTSARALRRRRRGGAAVPATRAGQLVNLTALQPETRRADRALGARVLLSKTPGRARSSSPLERGLGLPRPWDQQWRSAIQQILAYETDLLEYPDVSRARKVTRSARPRSPRGEGRARPVSPWAARCRPSRRAT